jgi:hypothetical protein
VLDLDSLDNATGFLDVGHSAANRGLKAICLPAESDNWHAAPLPRRAIVASGLEQSVCQFLGDVCPRRENDFKIVCHHGLASVE